MATETKIIISAVDNTKAAIASAKSGLGTLNEAVGHLGFHSLGYPPCCRSAH